MRNWLWAVLLGCVMALTAAGCGGDDDDGGWRRRHEGARGQRADAKGNVNWCIGKDTSGAYGTAIDLFKKENPNVTVKLVELPESADEQRTQLVQRLRAKSDECDVIGMDVIWTAEFAAQSWLQDTSAIIDQRQGDFIPSTLETAKYEDKYWAVPYHSNAGFIYFRTDVGRRGARELGGPLLGGRQERRPRLPGLRLRGPDRQLPRAALQRRRQGALG